MTLSMGRYLGLIAVLLVALPSTANAQWKQIPCDQTNFKASVPFQRCDYELSGHREIWTGAFHDNTSSAFVAVYAHPSSMRLEEGSSYAVGATAYRPFFDKYPTRSQLKQSGKWLTFPATVKTTSTSRDMNCLQFFKTGPPKGGGYAWTAIAAMCVTSGEVPLEAADLVLESFEVTLKR